jgi:integrase
MQSSKRVVRKRLASGEIREYRYDRKPPTARFAGDSLGALISAYKASPEWARLADASRATYGTYLKVLEADPHTAVASVKRRDILALRDAIATARGPGAATGFIRAASALFTWAVDREWIDNTPVTRIKALPKGHLPTWTADQVRTALAKLPEHLRRAVVLALHTGQRRGDLVAMRWDHYDGRTLRFTQQKTGRAMVLAVSPELHAELEAWRQTRQTLTLLHDAQGQPWVAQRLTERLKRALTIHGLPGLGIHGIRKHVAATLADRGATTHEIAAITGHRTLGMVALYTAQADQERLAKRAGNRLRQPRQLAAQRIEKKEE